MPMIAEAIFAIFATIKLGAVHSIVFGGFAAKELAVRINDCKPKVVFTASCGLEAAKVIDYKEIVDDALKILPELDIKVVLV